jgi:ParB family chromosome partitioning protein
LDVIEEARAYKKMQDYFELTQEEISKRVGKARSTVANTLRLLDLPIGIQRAVTEGKISEAHARTILAI